MRLDRQELTINYNYELADDPDQRMVCLCGEKNCRKYLR